MGVAQSKIHEIAVQDRAGLQEQSGSEQFVEWTSGSDNACSPPLFIQVTLGTSSPLLESRRMSASPGAVRTMSFNHFALLCNGCASIPVLLRMMIEHRLGSSCCSSLLFCSVATPPVCCCACICGKCHSRCRIFGSTRNMWVFVTWTLC